MSLQLYLQEHIQRDGAITIADYMQLALTHPEWGYYMKKDPLGAEGDFTTAPEISQVFGELCGLWLARQWEVMGRPHAALVELGPGRGTLMSDALRATAKIPGFHAAISVHLVEASPVLKQKQWQTLANKHGDVQWHETIDDLLPKPILLVANEFFDALPIQQFIQENGVWHERMITLNTQNELVFTLQKQALPPALTHLAEVKNTVLEYSAAAENILWGLSNHIATHQGAALIIDYGYAGGSNGDTLQAVKNHAPHEILSQPGEADLTAHVDFDFLKSIATSQSIGAYGPESQAKFLTAIGALVRLAKLSEKSAPEQKISLTSAVDRLLSPAQMGELFKVLCLLPKNHPKPEGF